jgi:hypothetical protein
MNAMGRLALSTGLDMARPLARTLREVEVTAAIESRIDHGVWHMERVLGPPHRPLDR